MQQLSNQNQQEQFQQINKQQNQLSKERVCFIYRSCHFTCVICIIYRDNYYFFIIIFRLGIILTKLSM